MKIQITQNGPYLVSGGVPLREEAITPVGQRYELAEGRQLPQSETYALCRCGHSANAPFCDGAHVTAGFDGTEVASREPYRQRLHQVITGQVNDLLDDGRCAVARFCHSERGDTWHLTMKDDDPANRELAVKTAGQCPAGRLTMVTKTGQALEDEARPAVAVLQDPEKQVSGPLAVTGPVTVESADGQAYEGRNRQALCRCGASSNKPFCDASHLAAGYNDGHLPTTQA